MWGNPLSFGQETSVEPDTNGLDLLLADNALES